MRRSSSSLFLLAVTLAFPGSTEGHDIPSDVTAHLFVKPAGSRLQLLVRVPLKAIRDVEFPERERGYLDVEKLAPQLPDAATVWITDFIAVCEGETLLPKPRVVGTQLSIDSDRSFASFEEAFEHVTGPKLANSANVFWNQVWFDVLLEYRIQSDRSEFSIRPGLERLGARVTTVLRFLPPGGGVRAYELPGDPGLVPLDPRWSQAAGRFVELGFFHILEGADHLLFLLCLVIPFRRLRPLAGVVTAFSGAHSITLLASAYGFAPDTLWFPPVIETLIAASIVYMAIENIVGRGTGHRRWLIAFGFGLVHGFGFSFALRETLQFAGSHLVVSLLSFNIGVEVGQILVLVLLIPVLEGIFRFIVAERIGTIILSAFVAHTGWHWLTERAARLSKFRFAWPDFNVGLLASATRWLMFILILAGIGWLVFRALSHRDRLDIHSD